MLVYRITLSKYAGELVASGRAACWNPNDVEMIYTASSRSLACLENAVHRDQIGLSALYSILTINCPDDLKTDKIDLDSLPQNWSDYNQMHITQAIGEKWIRSNNAAILCVPSSIITEEINYLLNPKHADFKLIKIVSSQPFVFDRRIKS